MVGRLDATKAAAAGLKLQLISRTECMRATFLIESLRWVPGVGLHYHLCCTRSWAELMREQYLQNSRASEPGSEQGLWVPDQAFARLYPFGWD